MPDPVSWLVVEPGWTVTGSDGNEVGRVHEVVGDSGKDIFNGLVVSPGMLRGNRYVPAEQVAEIVDGAVRLSLDGDGFGRLEDYDPPGPSLELRAD
ncbi:MAG: DUF2171 domain-containing protein [Gaiellaceae bacterium]